MMQIDLDRQPTPEQAAALDRYYGKVRYEILGFVKRPIDGDLQGGWCPITRSLNHVTDCLSADSTLLLIQRCVGNGRSQYDGYYNFVVTKELNNSILEAQAHRARIEAVKCIAGVIEV